MTDRHQAFDYVIVAAGSAGCVLAARLTEDETVSVLLHEAGPADRSWEIAMTSRVGRLLSAERFNWAYMFEPTPQLARRRLGPSRCWVLRGQRPLLAMTVLD